MMNSKEHFDFLVQNNIRKQEEDVQVISTLVNRLIDNLYQAKEGHSQFVVDKERLIKYNIEEREPINWGSLSCSEIKPYRDGTYQVVIGEASPEECPSLCEYIEKYMLSWGWGVEVSTEW